MNHPRFSKSIFTLFVLGAILSLGITAVAQYQDFSRSAGRQDNFRGASLGGLDSTYRTAPDGSPIIPCVVQLITDIDVPAQETGLLKEIHVVENQAVELGQILANMDDQKSQRILETAQLKHDLATRKAEDPTKILSAEEKVKLTSIEYEVNLKLYSKGSKTKQDALRSKYSRDISKFDLQTAINDKELAAVESAAELVNVRAAEDNIARHEIKAPINGQVFKIFKDPGEWVNAGEKIMRIAPLSRLRVHGTISAQNWDPHEVDGQKVTVTAMLARGRTETFTGRVVQTELEQRGNNLYLVVAEVENRYEPNSQHWILQPQSRVEMNIHVTPALSSPSNNGGENSAQMTQPLRSRQ